LIVVLGHTNCGIVRAALSAERIDGNVGDLLYEIFRSATEAGSPSAEDPVDDAVRANVLNSVRLLRESPTLQHLTRSGRVQVAGAVFNSSTSEIVWLGD
jgi:carbonic anhydrase